MKLNKILDRVWTVTHNNRLFYVKQHGSFFSIYEDLNSGPIKVQFNTLRAAQNEIVYLIDFNLI